MADDLLSAVVRTSYNHASPRTAGVVQDASKTHITSGVISANHWGSNISYSTTSLSLCYSDDCVISKKTSVSNWQRYCFIIGKHCKKLPLP